MAGEYTVRVHFINDTIRVVPARGIHHVGEEGARSGIALVDGREIPIYNRVEWGFLWEEQAPKASRDWHRRAIVRLLEDVTCHNAAFQRHTYTRGQEVEMIQWGRQDSPVDQAWWSDFDIDLAFIIADDSVEVIRVVDEVTPF